MSAPGPLWGVGDPCAHPALIQTLTTPLLRQLLLLVVVIGDAKHLEMVRQTMASAEREPITGHWGGAPSGVQGQTRGHGVRDEGALTFRHPMEAANCLIALKYAKSKNNASTDDLYLENGTANDSLARGQATAVPSVPVTPPMVVL